MQTTSITGKRPIATVRPATDFELCFVDSRPWVATIEPWLAKELPQPLLPVRGDSAKQAAQLLLQAAWMAN